MKKQILKRWGCLLASVVFAFVAGSAHAAAWFDGEIATKPDLTGGDVNGSWTIPESGGWTAGEGKGEYNNFADPLKFTAKSGVAIPGNIASITTSIKFTAKDEVTEDEAAGAKAGLAVVEEDAVGEDGAPTGGTVLKYFGIVNGKWEELSGATPTLESAVSVSISLSAAGTKRFVSYKVGDDFLTLEGKSDIETSFGEDTSATISSVEYLGKGVIESLVGEKEASKFDLTVPAVAGAEASVKVNGDPATAKSGNVYEIPYGATVEVTYAGSNVTVSGGTIKYENFDGSVKVVDTKDVEVTVSLTVPAVDNTTVEVKVGEEKVEPPTEGDVYTFAYATENVTVAYTPVENYKFTEGDGKFDYASLTENMEVDTTKFKVAEKAKFSVIFMTNLSETPYATKEVYEGAKLGEFTTPNPVDGYNGAWADPAPTADDVINALTTYTYNYTAISYTIAVTADETKGTATATPATYTIGAEAQTVTLTATPADGYKFDKWVLTEKEGVSIDGDTLTIAAGTIDDIAIQATFAEDKIIPIDDPDLPKMDVNKDAFPGKSESEIKNYLKTEQANGQPGWVNYALGIADDDPPILVAGGDADTIKIDLGNEGTAPKDSGITSKIVKGTDVLLENGEISLNNETETEVFTVSLVLTDKNGTPTTVVEKDVGIERKEVASELEVISVPFTAMNDEEKISVDQLVKAMNLVEGDRLMVYNAKKGQNEGWTWNGTAWTADAGVAPAAKTFVKPGDGLWFQHAVDTPVFKFGAFAAAKESTETPVNDWKLVANPNLTGEVDLNDDFIDGVSDADDEIQVETATTPLIYTYVDGSWGYNKVETSTSAKTGRTVKKNVRSNNAKVGAGVGFWFFNSNPSVKKHLKWTK